MVWEPGAVPSEEQFVGAFPLADAGVDDGFSLQMLSGLQSAVSAGSGSTSIRLKHISVRFPLAVYPDFAQFHSQRLAHTLHPIIVATFLDCAPTAFGLGLTNSTELELIASVANISRSLYGAILQEVPLVRSDHVC